MRAWLTACLWLAPALVLAADGTERVRVFGHLTQAYGRSDRGTILGSSENGTTDLRKIAIQFRWQLSDSDDVIIQFSHERIGDDIFFPKDDEVEVDWAFYERRIGLYGTLRVGRLNVPLGIYNEIRDVGTLVPFFNLPISFYAGVLSTAETVDGLSFNHTFWPRSDWGLEAEIYVGGWDTFQQQVEPAERFGIANRAARAEDGYGLQLWLDTPVPGLRIGAGSLTWQLAGPLSINGAEDRWDAYHLSIDATLERWVMRAETRRWLFDQDFGAFQGRPPLPGRAERKGSYLQIGRWLNEKIAVFGQIEETSLGDDLDLFPELDDLHREAAVSLNYRVRPDLVAKVEYHTARTRFPLGEPDRPDSIVAEPVDVDWAIVGLSVSF